MNGLLYLAWRHLDAHRGRALLVVSCIALALWVPWTASRLAARYDVELRARAEATPLVVGAPGNRYDLTLAAPNRRHVRLVLDRVDGDEAAAVELLGISQKQLTSHLTD